jgi:hypothetical protein
MIMTAKERVAEVELEVVSLLLPDFDLCVGRLLLPVAIDGSLRFCNADVMETAVVVMD